MTGAAETTVAVLAALAAACSFGVGVAVQHRQVQLASTARGAPGRLLVHLAWRRRKALFAPAAHQEDPR